MYTVAAPSCFSVLQIVNRFFPAPPGDDRYTFGIASLSNKKELLQVGDPVQFQPSAAEQGFAVNVKSTREKNRAFVEAMKGEGKRINTKGRQIFRNISNFLHLLYNLTVQFYI